ncbi:MAG: hypothetical protein ABI850_09010 [Flavobacterium sp.]
MESINKTNPFRSVIKKTALGILTILDTDIKISTQGSISFNNKSILTNNIYKDDSYSLVYTIIDLEGKEESYVENDGILPTLFLSPKQENYVSIIPYHPNKEVEISVPIFNRADLEIPKRNRPFTGKFIGIYNQFSIFYDVDIFSDTKPDKLLAIEFKENSIKKKHTIKIPLPKNNRISISDNEIHLLAIENSVWLHRQIDEKGNILKERKLKANSKRFNQILNLSFNESSYILYQEKGKLFVEDINSDETCIQKQLLDFKDTFYNTWQPEKIGENTFVIRFNTEHGNGWFTIKKDKLLEFFYSKDVKGFKNILTNEILEIESNKLIISSLNKTKEDNYLVVFYPSLERGLKNNRLMTLNRELKQ